MSGRRRGKWGIERERTGFEFLFHSFENLNKSSDKRPWRRGIIIRIIEFVSLINKCYFCSYTTICKCFGLCLWDKLSQCITNDALPLMLQLAVGHILGVGMVDMCGGSVLVCVGTHGHTNAKTMVESDGWFGTSSLVVKTAMTRVHLGLALASSVKQREYI